MTNRYYDSPEKLFNDLLGLSTTVLQSPLAKEILTNCTNNENCVNEELTGRLNAQAKTFDDKYVVIAEVPGLKDEDITIEFKDKNLALIGDYKNEEDFDKIRKGKWACAFKFKDVDGEKIEAKLENGQLIVSLFKKPEAQPIKIQINK